MGALVAERVVADSVRKIAGAADGCFSRCTRQNRPHNSLVACRFRNAVFSLKYWHGNQNVMVYKTHSLNKL